MKMTHTHDDAIQKKGEMFRCSAHCCDDTSTSSNDMQRCLERCAAPAMKADKFMQEQMQDIQERFQRCAMSCADKIKDQAGSYGDLSASNPKNREAMEACVVKCGDEMIKVLPSMTKKMREWFNKGYYLQ